MLAVELRPEETGRSLKNVVGALTFSDFLVEFFDSLRLGGGHPGRISVVDVDLAHSRPDRLHAVAQLADHPVHYPMLVPNSVRNARTIRIAPAFSSGLYRRDVGFPGTCSCGNSILVAKVWSLRGFPGRFT